MSAAKALRLGKVAILCLVVVFVGCTSFESAHYVLRNPDCGVVAIPEDTPELRAKAEKLMHQQFPAGYVIDDVHVELIGRLHHQHTEVMLYYHSGVPTSAGAPVVVIPTSPGPMAVSHVQPAAPPAAQPGGLPPQPIPVDAR